MCGIYAFTGPVPASWEDLRMVARAARRGPHGHGWIGERSAFFTLGLLRDEHLPAAPGTWLLGHARLGTTGARSADITALQPVTRAGHTLVHNGSLHSWPEAYARTDSHHLLDTYTRTRAMPGVKAEVALSLTLRGADHGAWAVILRDANGTLLASRRGLPLFTRRNPDGGVLVSSVTFDGSEALPESTVHTLWRP